MTGHLGKKKKNLQSSVCVEIVNPVFCCCFIAVCILSLIVVWARINHMN